MPIRDVTTATSASTSFSCPAPDHEPGDRLVACQLSDADDPSSLTVPSGGGWTPLTPIDDSAPVIDPDGNTFTYQLHTRAWTKLASTEPARYRFGQAADADSVIIIVSVSGASTAAPRVATASDNSGAEQITTPSVVSPSGGGTELRFAGGTDAFGSTPSWTVGTGITRYTSDLQSGVWVSAVLGSREVTSGGPTGTSVFDSHWPMTFVQAVTILVPAAGAGGGGGQAPTPPTYPTFTPALGTALYRYTAHDLLTGVYKFDLYPRDVTYDRRIGEPGQFSATLDIPNSKVAEQVAAIVPRQPSDLSTGPGPTVIHVWRGGELWGVYWLTSATVARSRQQRPTATLRGSTLDAYLSYLEIQEDVDYVDLDQLDILRDLVGRAQAMPHANIGLLLPAGASGQFRTISYKDADRKTFGQAISDLAKIQDGFEYVVNPAIINGELQRQLLWGYPQLGDPAAEHVFADSPHGGDILDWSEEIRLGATRVRVRGDTPPADDGTDISVERVPLMSTPHDSAAHFDAGWPLICTTIDRQGVTDINPLEQYAAYWLAKSAGTVWVRSVTVALGKYPTLKPENLGDRARFLLIDEWHPRAAGAASFDVSQRVIGMQIKPVGRGTAKDEATLILEGQVGT
ncbi:MAG TPA: hypothetical protein VIR33_01655 [Thermopolyspora sp.]